MSIPITTVEQATAAGSYDKVNGPGAYSRTNGGTIQDPTKTTQTTQTDPKSSPALIVTSGQSRNEYANNVNNYQAAVGNIAVPNYGDPVKDATGKVVGTAQYNPNTGEPLQPKDVTTKVDDSKTATNDFSAKLPPEIKSQYDETIANLNDGVASAKAALESARSNLAHDPAADAALSQISSYYDQQIQLMTEKNKIVAGGNVRNAARTGSLQYTNEMTENFLSDQQDRATQRIVTLNNQKTAQLLKSAQAFKSGDLKAFNDAQKSYESANKEKIDAINHLLTESAKVVKQQQDEIKAAKNADKQEITDNIRISNSIAPSMADTIAKSGLSGKDLDSYIEAMATESGITNTDMLKASVVKAQQTLGRYNKSMTVKTKGSSTPVKGGGTDGGFKYTSNDISTYTGLMNQGGKSPTGQNYAGRGSDGYVDPGAYTASLNDWVKNGGTPLGFVKKFPVKTNVNPDDYEHIPAAVRPAK